MTAIVKAPRNGAASLIHKTITDIETTRKFIVCAFKKDVDYGQIPGIDKKFLLQPGAEKFALWTRVRPVYEVDTEKLMDGHLDVVARCKLVSIKDQQVMAEGPWCSFTTMESNSRYRWIQPVCPECAGKPGQCPKCGGKGFAMPAKEKAAEMKALGMGKWVPEKSKDGKTILGWKWFERRDNPNIHDERNKARQMACKRAFVKAIRTMGALSEIFTEDPSEWVFESDAIDMPLFSSAPGVTMEPPENPAVKDVWPKREADAHGA